MPSARRQDQYVARVDLEMAALCPAEHHRGGAGDDAENLVGGRVEMVERKPRSAGRQASRWLRTDADSGRRLAHPARRGRRASVGASWDRAVVLGVKGGRGESRKTDLPADHGDTSASVAGMSTMARPLPNWELIP